MLIGPWAAMSQLEKVQVPMPVGGTSSPAPRLQAFSGLKVGLHPGPGPFYPGTCLSLATIHGTQAVCAKGCLQVNIELPSAPPGLSPMLIGAQSPKGAKVAGGWCVSAALSLYTHGQVATAPRLGLNFALRSHQVLTVERSQAAGPGTSEPAVARTGLPGPPRLQRRLGPQLHPGRLQLRLGGWGSCLPGAQVCLRCSPGLGGCNCA